LNLSAEIIAGFRNIGGEGIVCEHLVEVPVNKNRLLEVVKKNGLIPNA